MAKFVSTISFTEQGMGAIRDTTRRAAAFKSAAKKMGVKVAEVYWCLGPFDGLLLFEAPDASSATAAMLQLAAQGNVKTCTAQLFGAEEMDKILSGILRE
jgi:uncharacterized protein with GYD domain